MHRSMRRPVWSVIVLLVGSSVLVAQGVGDVATNWTVPPYTRTASPQAGFAPMVDISPGVGFTAMQPCRVVDTRGGGSFVGAYGPPAMLANQQRDFDINSAGHCPGIPAGVEAYSLNFTVTQTAGAPGDIRVWPTGNPPPPAQITSVLNWQFPNTSIANATIVPAGTGGSITVFVAGTGTHLLIDINGYFTDEQNPGQSFQAVGSVPGGGAVFGLNTSSVAESSGVRGQNNSGSNQAYGVHGEITTTTSGVLAAGVRGVNLGTDNDGFGVWGSHAGSGSGVYGSSEIGFAVRGVSGNIAIHGASSNQTGVVGTTTSVASMRSGVFGIAHGDSGQIYGVHGTSNSNSADSAGVFGSADENDDPVAVAGASSKAGVRGESAGFGVLGISESIGSAGLLVNASGTLLAYGWVATDGGVDAGGAAPWSFFGNQDIGSPGNKSFVEPHPTDADKIIQYIALEGPEAGTYFRGRARFQNGLATIPVPDDFRMVTDPEGLTVQITPMGAMASVGVLRANLEEIVVQSSRNVEFSYLVQGVRRAFKESGPIRKSAIFAPQHPDARLDESLAPDLKRRLVDNGSYNPDGTANLETAKRLGWDKAWEKRTSRPAPQPEVDADSQP